MARDMWVSGYYPGWVQQQVPPSKLNMDSITHLFHFAATVKPDGTFTVTDFGLTDEHIAATVKRAHDAGKKVVFVLGGANSGPGFVGATNNENRPKFIEAVLAFVAKHKYDGIDIDWEPLRKADNTQYKTFVLELRAAMKKQNAELLLTAATGPDPLENKDIGKLFADLQEQFDQINLMTYVLAGPWPGWMTWHGSALYNGGLKFGNGRELPSIEANCNNFVAAGVHPSKLGIGLAFHADVWTGGTGTPTGGVTAPQQNWKTPPKLRNDVSYAEMMAKYYKPERVRYDDLTESPYLSIDMPDARNDMFISYSDAKAIGVRLEFMKTKGYGGCIIWNIGQDTLPSGQQPLAAAVAAFLAQNIGE